MHRMIPIACDRHGDLNQGRDRYRLSVMIERKAQKARSICQVHRVSV